jgi:hypothetical protein
MAVSTLPSGMAVNILSDGLEPNQGHWLGVLSGTYTAGNVVLAADKTSGGIEVRFGIKPIKVEISNRTDRISLEATYGSTSGLLTVAAGTRTYVTHGLTWGERSLGITAATNSLITDNDTVVVEVWS